MGSLLPVFSSPKNMKIPRMNVNYNYKKILGTEEFNRIKDILEKQSHPSKSIKEDTGWLLVKSD